MSDVAIVTGGASGIGAAVVAALRRRGYVVGALDLSGRADADHVVAVDVSDGPAVAAAVAEMRSRLGPVSALVTSAGHYEMVPVSDITAQAWRRMLRVHLGGLANATRACLPDTLERRSGAVVAVASELAVGGADQDAHYAAAKGAILGLVRSLAAEVADRGVRVNAVAPGPPTPRCWRPIHRGGRRITCGRYRWAGSHRRPRWRAASSSCCATPRSAPATSST